MFAHYFGSSGVGDAFTAAFRIPNFLQNVFGEGALSASFIPVYAKLLAHHDEKEAARVANAIFTLLALITSTIVLFGVLFTPAFVTAIAGGFQDERRELTIRLVRILFPGAGLLVLSAWCLGVLNSHHRFFISYTAPVAWNLCIIAALLFFGRRVDLAPLAEATGMGFCCRKRTSVRSSVTQRPPPDRSLQADVCAGRRPCSTSGSQLFSSFHESRHSANQRFCGRVVGELSRNRSSRCTELCPEPLHAAGESVWHVGVSGGAPFYVEGDWR